VLTGGLGGMGGAQPLAVTMNGGVCLAVEVDPRASGGGSRRATATCIETSLDAAVARVEAARRDGEALSIGLCGNCAEVLPELVRRGFHPDAVTDQTSAHDELNGYVPAGLISMRRRVAPATMPRTWRAACDRWRRTCGPSSISAPRQRRLRLRQQPARPGARAGVPTRSTIRASCPAYVRPLFCDGKGRSAGWRCRATRPTSRAPIAGARAVPADKALARWIRLASERVVFQGLPARILLVRLRRARRVRLALNELVARGELAAPIVIGRDHLDSGSVASPYRETEGMRDGSDAVADWPLLNALVNAVERCHVGLAAPRRRRRDGLSIHAGMVVVADGTPAASKDCAACSLVTRAMGIARHADAGYPEALDAARRHVSTFRCWTVSLRLRVVRGSELRSHVPCLRGAPAHPSIDFDAPPEMDGGSWIC
jgi:urocanate hydratase